MMLHIILVSFDREPLAVAEATRKAAFRDATISLYRSCLVLLRAPSRLSRSVLASFRDPLLIGGLSFGVLPFPYAFDEFCGKVEFLPDGPKVMNCAPFDRVCGELV